MNVGFIRVLTPVLGTMCAELDPLFYLSCLPVEGIWVQYLLDIPSTSCEDMFEGVAPSSFFKSIWVWNNFERIKSSYLVALGNNEKVGSSNNVQM